MVNRVSTDLVLRCTNDAPGGFTQARHNRERAINCRLRFVPLFVSPFAARTSRNSKGVRDLRHRVVRDDRTASSLSPAIRSRRASASPVRSASRRGWMSRSWTKRKHTLPPGQTGEIVIRGATVMAAYDRDPTATEDAFAGDWFKTGDHGFFDEDGYVYLGGRVHEIINRGGEKIAPQEVDEVLLEHPAVAEAVTFAVPHGTLGEDVASAIVLRPGAAASPRDIRQFATAASPISRFRVKSSLSRKFQRARLAKCSVSAWRQIWVLPTAGGAAGLRRAKDAALDSIGQALGRRSRGRADRDLR